MQRLRQSINFYRDEFKKPDIALPASQMLQIFVVVLAGFLVIGSYQIWSLQELKNDIAERESQRSRLQAQYESMQTNFVEPKEDASLLEQLKSISRDVNRAQKLKRFLDIESAKSLFSFASVLDALADSDARDIWLTEISIKTSGRQYQLKGVAQYAENIPEYIERLKQADALQGTSFNVFSVEQGEGSDGLLYFILSSEIDNEQDEE
ncbi:MAG: hypothetical protein CSA49_05325 [Gammaproteobacteria bacterium]|nr:MAG: hypothetical protein CSA49_05325 [Gammaproteobacteria bacterium]